MMQRGWQQSKQHNRRLSQQSSIPGVPDLEFLFNEAMNNRGQGVELPFIYGEPKTSFCLLAQTGRRGSDQELTWTLYRGETAAGTAEWTYESKDLLMIHGLIMLVFAGGNAASPGKQTPLPLEARAQAIVPSPSQPAATAPDKYIKYLDEAGLKLESCLFWNHPSLTEAEFEKTVARGIPFDLRQQKLFYRAVDGKTRLMEIVEKLSLDETEWVPVMFNMLSCGLLSFAKGVDEGKEDPAKAGVESIESATNCILQALVRPDSGLFTHAAFLYFLEQEHARFESFGRPFSVILFRLGMRTTLGGKQSVEPLPPDVLKEVLSRLSRMKRKADLLAHYENIDYALLLPETDGKASRGFASRLTEFLFSIPSTASFDASQVTVTIGVASLPQDTQDPAMLLTMARSNRNKGDRS